MNSNWIKTSERTPVFGDYLCLIDGEHGRHMRILCAYNGVFKYETDCEESVTHWMELPDYPNY